MRALLENLPLKLMSLGPGRAAVVVIAGEKTSEMGLSRARGAAELPPRPRAHGEPVNAVEVRLRASPGIIQRLVPGEVSAQIDLAGVGEGEHIVHLTEDSIRVPFGVKVVKITPSCSPSTSSARCEKVVPVRPRLLGRPAAGYEVAEVTSEPGRGAPGGPDAAGWRRWRARSPSRCRWRARGQRGRDASPSASTTRCCASWAPAGEGHGAHPRASRRRARSRACGRGARRRGQARPAARAT